MSELPRLALSVRQPWAWAIIYGGKHLENRTQGALNYMPRGVTWLAIHASRGMTRDEYESALLTFEDAHRAGQLAVPLDAIPKPHALVRGAIIGHVAVVDRLSYSPSPWFCGPRALVFGTPQAIDPIPSVGSLGYFEWRASAAQAEQPKPWMMAWPEEARRSQRGAEAPQPHPTLL